MATLRLVTGTDMPVPDDEIAMAADALNAAGLDTEIVEWRDPRVDWHDSAIALLWSTWDYCPRVAEFLRWADAAAACTRLLNQIQIVHWNVHKQYLLDLEEGGVPIVPTALVRAGAVPRLDMMMRERGWDEVVLKPAINAGGFDTYRAGAGDQARLGALAADRDVLVQEYVGGVERAGELSMLYIDGELMHSVAKLPAPGEFRTQPEYASTIEAREPSASALEVADAALAALGSPPLYARVDLIDSADIDAERAMLVELELIEPYFYLRYAGDRGRSALEALADGIRRRL